MNITFSSKSIYIVCAKQLLICLVIVAMVEKCNCHRSYFSRVSIPQQSMKNFGAQQSLRMNSSMIYKGQTRPSRTVLQVFSIFLQYSSKQVITTLDEFSWNLVRPWTDEWIKKQPKMYILLVPIGILWTSHLDEYRMAPFP